MIRAADKWLAGYLRSVLARPRRVAGPRHLMFCVCDHFEPSRSGHDQADWPAYVKDWCGRHAALADYRDADGVHPRHTFFYPEDEHDAGSIAALAAHTALGLGEVEVHLHHRNDTAEGLREKLASFTKRLREEHGLLGERRGQGGKKEKGMSNAQEVEESKEGGEIGIFNFQFSIFNERAGGPAYAFIHGNWALCNSRPDGDWCGVDNELTALAETGCYADFTFPSAPSPTQPRKVNSIYRAQDTGRPRAADRGIEVECRPPGKKNASKIHNSPAFAGPAAGMPFAVHSPPSLMLITGPLALDWRRRKWGVMPRLENGEISGVNPPSPHRTDLWVDQSIHVRGRSEWVFVKVHTHGCVPANAAALLGAPMRAFHADLARRYNDGTNWRLHYVTAREQYNIVRAAEDGMTGSPGEYRNYEIKPPPGRRME